ncbi:MAG: hypothetical protein HY689_04525 [Chloroflexi bacterium]|nr:hypothetical protein [Chloroflexota bacterium]
MLAQRWAVEVWFENLKDLLGSDHYQVRRAAGVLRIWTLVACLTVYLDEQRAEQAAEQGYLPSRGDARRATQAEHRGNLVRGKVPRWRAARWNGCCGSWGSRGEYPGDGIAPPFPMR